MKRITFGLVSLTLSILFAAQALGLMPDRDGALIEKRVALCEALAIECSMAAQLQNDAALETVAKVNDEVFARPLPDENYRQHFSTIGVATLVYCCSHIAVHMGQVSTWRRCMGLGAIQ